MSYIIYNLKACILCNLDDRFFLIGAGGMFYQMNVSPTISKKVNQEHHQPSAMNITSAFLVMEAWLAILPSPLPCTQKARI
jgi:hypothetical protein